MAVQAIKKVMKIRIAASLFLVAVGCSLAEPPRLPYSNLAQPMAIEIRRVNGTNYNLGIRRQYDTKSRVVGVSMPTTTPLPDWFQIRGQVVDKKHGILLVSGNYPKGYANVKLPNFSKSHTTLVYENRIVALKNYPRTGQVKIADTVGEYAMKVGTFGEYVLYDYGEPVSQDQR